MTTIVLLLVLIMLVTVFSVQNAFPVAVSFFFWKFEASLAIVIFLSALSGILFAAILGLSGKLKKKIKTHNKPETGPTNE